MFGVDLLDIAHPRSVLLLTESILPVLLLLIPFTTAVTPVFVAVSKPALERLAPDVVKPIRILSASALPMELLLTLKLQAPAVLIPVKAPETAGLVPDAVIEPIMLFCIALVKKHEARIPTTVPPAPLVAT
jgi:hypothetical protein